MTGAFAENEQEIVQILENTNDLTADLAAITEKLDASATALQKIMEGDGAQTIAQAEALVTETRSLVTDLRKITGENRTAIRAFANQGLGQVAPALAQARQLMRSLDNMLNEIDRDPQAYFLGEQAPEYEGEDDD